MNESKNPKADAANRSRKKIKKSLASGESSQAPVSPACLHDPKEIVVVAADISFKGIPKLECGPVAWACFQKSDVSPRDVLGNSVLQSASAPRWRGFFESSKKKTVFVVSDIDLPESEVLAVAACYSHAVGTYTEAKRLASGVRWLSLPSGFSVAHIADLAAGELGLAISEDTQLKYTDVIFVVWKQRPASFGAAPALEIGRAICTATFTTAELIEADLSDDEYE